MRFPIEAKLKDGAPIRLSLADTNDVELLRRLYEVIVEEGTSYPHRRYPVEYNIQLVGVGGSSLSLFLYMDTYRKLYKETLRRLMKRNNCRFLYLKQV